MDERTFSVYASERIHTAEDTNAVIIGYGQIAISLSIGQARELSMDLARAADQAELTLPE